MNTHIDCHCDNALKRAKDFCADNGYQLSAPRRNVLKSVIQNHKPMGAYEIIDDISDNNKDKVKPPTVYRALEFWTDHGFMHKIESLNKYISCCHGEHHDSFGILICDDCGDTQEIHINPLSKAQHNNNLQQFTPHTIKTEIHGRCGACHQK